MNKAPLVSAVIATYNAARFLPAAIRSVLTQNYPNLELILIDDGSKDDTEKVVETLLEDPRVRYIRQANQGQAIAKNRGIAEARGDYIAFLDADDLWLPGKLALQIPLFSRSQDTGIVYARLDCIDEDGNLLPDRSDANYPRYRGRVTSRLFVENFVRFGTSVVRRDCFEQLGVFDSSLKMGIDYDLWLRLSTRYEFDYVDQPLLQYRLWGGQMSSNCQGRYENGLAIMTRFLQNHPHTVAPAARKLAFAATYAGLGQCLRSKGGPLGPALSCFFQALRYKPAHLPTWRLLVEALLGRRREVRP